MRLKPMRFVGCVMMLALVLSVTVLAAPAAKKSASAQPLVSLSSKGTPVDVLAPSESAGQNGAVILQRSASPDAGSFCNPVCIAGETPGTGTVDLPAQCPYMSENGTLDIKNGLNPGDELHSRGMLHNFFNIQQFPGGPLGGGYSQYQAQLQMEMSGTGTYSGYNRTLTIPISSSQMDFMPRTPGTSPQSFDCEIFGMQGQLTPGDPDFDLLRITAGNGFGMPSPGHTTLTKQGGTTNWQVESFFDIEYRIDFIGAPGGPFAGRSGSTTGTIRMSNIGHHYWVDGDPHKMHYPQRPDPAGWDVFDMNRMYLADDWRCSESGPVKDIHFWGSWLNDNIATVDSFNVCIFSDIPVGAADPYSHPGQLLWQRTITNWCELAIAPPTAEGWYDPSTQLVLPNNHFRYYQYDIDLPQADWFIQDVGTIYWLCIRAYVCDPLGGARWGWKSTQDHFNDDAVWLVAGQPTCPSPDNGAGSTDLPAQCPIPNENGTYDIIDGLPAGNEINSQGTVLSFSGIIRTPGGPLGGEVDDCQAVLEMRMKGSGSIYGGYLRNLAMPISLLRVAHGPRNLCSSLQDFPSDLQMMQGQLPPGDPDFDLLRITAGTGFGLPSPGHTTLTALPGNTWNVESFFDITYRIDFVGSPAGPFAGRSGSTTGTIRIHQGWTSPGGTWLDLHVPSAVGESMDLAFVITNGQTDEPCCDLPGDADNDSSVSIGDAVYLIAYIFSGGPPPPCLQEGDANGDASIDIGDVVFLIQYIFQGGLPPVCGP